MMLFKVSVGQRIDGDMSDYRTHMRVQKLKSR
jgi:hypothetical protein